MRKEQKRNRNTGQPRGRSGREYPHRQLNIDEVYTPQPPTLHLEATVSKYDFINCPTRINHNGPYHPDDVIAAIRLSRGNFYEMSRLLGRRRNAIRDYVYANLMIKDVYDEVREGIIDQAEKTLQQIALEDRDPASLRFLLSTLGKDRGYSHRVEATGEDGSPLVFELNLSGKTYKQDEKKEVPIESAFEYASKDNATR